jgi:hypothetical protein
MADTAGLISLRHVCNNVLVLSNVDSKFREKITQIIINGFKKLNIFVNNSLRSVILDVDTDLNVVHLPKDYIDYIKIYVLSNNKIYQLTRSEEIPLPRTEDCGVDTNLQQTVLRGETPVETLIDGIFPNSILYHHYGTSGGGNAIYYRIDRERGMIILQGTPTDGKIYLEYISTGINMDEQTMIPQECEETLVKYALWQMCEYDPRVPASDKDRKERQYKEELRWLVAFLNPFDIQEYLDTLYSTSRQTPKR